jgi:hypothetical protein
LAASTARTHDREEDLAAAADKLGRHLFEVSIRLTVLAPHTDAGKSRSLLRAMAGTFAQFTVPRMAAFRSSRVRRRRPRAGGHFGRGFLLSCEELATLWHPPTSTVRVPSLDITESRELEPPVNLPTRSTDADLAVLGKVGSRGRRELFGIRPDDRRRHLAVIGKTGMGKTTLLHKLIASDIQAGRGCALVDPHGDLVSRQSSIDG